MNLPLDEPKNTRYSSLSVEARERRNNRTEKKEYFESLEITNPRQKNWFWDFPKT
ncbi:hypothetical protein ACN23B_24975 [Anabaena sp. FACHB-709]|uniref:hypothetical protein n=1 Tax=Nostocaceae TaxID=1162 RepID=UPI0003099516|nr:MULTISPECIES: hypothetical protein [Nostocaceae]MBD2287340.1 hypothetical protein [Anabaena cylindrica FACHB-170]